MRLVILMLGMAVLAGCVSLNLRVASHSFRPGEVVPFELANDGWREACGNLCLSSLERRCGLDWISVEQSRRCRMMLYCYGSGTVERYAHFRLASSLPNGTYRIVTSIEVGGSNRKVASNEFRVVDSTAPGSGCDTRTR